MFACVMAIMAATGIYRVEWHGLAPAWASAGSALRAGVTEEILVRALGRGDVETAQEAVDCIHMKVPGPDGQPKDVSIRCGADGVECPPNPPPPPAPAGH